MPRGILPEVKLQAVKDYISGNGSYLSHASELGVDESVFRRWVNKYKAFGESAFIRTGHNQSYSASFKKCVVEAYLNGEGSYRELAVTYNIPSENTIGQWVLKYNGHEKLKASGTGGKRRLLRSLQIRMNLSGSVKKWLILFTDKPLREKSLAKSLLPALPDVNRRFSRAGGDNLSK